MIGSSRACGNSGFYKRRILLSQVIAIGAYSWHRIISTVAIIVRSLDGRLFGSLLRPGSSSNEFQLWTSTHRVSAHEYFTSFTLCGKSKHFPRNDIERPDTFLQVRQTFVHEEDSDGPVKKLQNSENLHPWPSSHASPNVSKSNLHFSPPHQTRMIPGTYSLTFTNCRDFQTTMKGWLRILVALAPLLGAFASSPPILKTRQSTTDQSAKYVLPVGSRKSNN